MNEAELIARLDRLLAQVRELVAVFEAERQCLARYRRECLALAGEQPKDAHG